MRPWFITTILSAMAMASSWSWGDMDERGAGLALDLLQLVLHLLAQVEIEGAQGFIQQQHVRSHRQGAGQGDPLALAAGQLMGLLSRGPGQIDHLEELQGAPFRLPAGNAPHFRSEHDVGLTVMCGKRA